MEKRSVRRFCPQLRIKRVLLGILGIFVTAEAVYIICRLLAFVQLFGKFGPHAGLEITQPAVFAAHNVSAEERQSLIPKIIHSIFHNWTDPSNNDLPDDWLAMRQTCIEKNPEWEFKVCRMAAPEGKHPFLI
jgi:hypothetical protein